MRLCVAAFLEQRFWAALAAVVATFLIAACASSTSVKESNAAVLTAQNLERRAGQSYAQGDLQAAAATYASAALVYESLALAEPLARARLSEARVLAEAGQTDRAVQLVDDVLEQLATASKTVGADTLALAHGRAAALQLEQHGATVSSASSAATNAIDPPSTAAATSTPLTLAQNHWQNAQTACASTCGAKAALLVLRARIDLAQGNANAAMQSASAALAAGSAPANNPEQANALRARAQAQAALGQHAGTVTDANAALVLDQQAGSASRVGADLELLAMAHQALGNTAQAQRFAQLAQRARAAATALQRGAP